MNLLVDVSELELAEIKKRWVVLQVENFQALHYGDVVEV